MYILGHFILLSNVSLYEDLKTSAKHTEPEKKIETSFDLERNNENGLLFVLLVAKISQVIKM